MSAKGSVKEQMTPFLAHPVPEAHPSGSGHVSQGGEWSVQGLAAARDLVSK